MSKPWQRQERRLASATNGSVNAGSGAFDRKGDVRTANVAYECKWTGKQQITIQASVLEKIFDEAYATGRVPCTQIEVNKRTYIVAEFDDWLEGRDAIDELTARDV